MNVEDVLRDPPQLHPTAPFGVWRTETACYEFLAAYGEGRVTLETGIGISTVVLNMVAAQHTCITLNDDEVLALSAYFAERDIPDHVMYRVGSSPDVLPSLVKTEPLDLFFIDGGHGFPTPCIDFFYGARMLRDGGILVMDDVQLPGPSVVIDFLNRDERWHRFPVQGAWVAYQRIGEWPMAEDWTHQPFFGAPNPLWEVIRDRNVT